MRRQDGERMSRLFVLGIDVEPTTVAPAEPGYPAGLEVLQRPPVLFALGNVALLNRPCVGICGSRSATGQAISHAAEFGSVAAERGFVVVSGYARGVDVAAHLGAMEAGGATIAVLAEGTDHFGIRRELRQRTSPTNLLAISTFAPETRWSAWRAMERNRYIVALSRGLFVIEARERGGTFEAGLECLRQRKPLWVIEYPNGGSRRKGNTELILKGGIPVKGRNNLRSILEDAWLRAPPRQAWLAVSLSED